MKSNQLIYIVCVIGTLFLSCTKETETMNTTVRRGDVASYERLFSEILSKAMYESEPLRSFIKNKALEEFDKDNDVFYPFVKNEVVCEGKTFRELLLPYCESNDQLKMIEAALPLLNILVPDVSWIEKDGFCAKNWDTSDNEIAVTYRDGNTDGDFFGNGEVVCSITGNQIPAFPVVIVKQNERIRAVQTKSGEIDYSFTYQAFDNTLKTRGGTQNYSGTIIPWTVGDSATVTAATLAQVSQIARDAYEEFGSNSSVAPQRDYCYYGMTNSNSSNGTLSHNVFERLYRFKLNYSALSLFADDTGDPIRTSKYQDSIYVKGDNDIEIFTDMEAALTGAILIDASFFTDGNFEVVINCISLTSTGQSIVSPYPFSIRPYELFEFNRVDFNYIHASFWRKAKYTYTYDMAYIQTKWYYPQVGDNDFFNWSLATKSTAYVVEVMEVDSGNTLSYSDTQSYSITSNVSIQGGTEIKTSYGYSQTSSNSTTITTSRTETSDLLSRFAVEYTDDVVLNKSIGVDTLYTLRSYGNGAVSVCILPVVKY